MYLRTLEKWRKSQRSLAHGTENRKIRRKQSCSVHKMRLIATDVARSVVCVYVCWGTSMHELCKNGWTDWDDVGGKGMTDSCGSKEPCIRCGARSNKFIRSREGWQDGDDTASCQISLDSYLYLILLNQVDSAFYPPWDGKMSTSQRAVMLCGWEGNRKPGGK